MIPSITDEYLKHIENEFYYYHPMLEWTKRQTIKRDVPDWVVLDLNGLEKKVEHLRMEIYFLRDELEVQGIVFRRKGHTDEHNNDDPRRRAEEQKQSYRDGRSDT